MRSFQAMLHRLWRAEGQSRAARTVEVFGWLISGEAILIVFAPHVVASVLHLPALVEQGANYFRLAGLLVGGVGMLYVVSGRLNAEGFVFATLLDRPLVPPAMAILWYLGLIPGPLALAFALQDFGTFLWTLVTWRAEMRIPVTVDALGGTVSGEVDSPSIRATELIYVAAMLEQAKMFQTVDRLVQLFQSGRLPIGRGQAAEKLYTYGKAAALRMSERERRAVYHRVLGIGAEGGEISNRDFHDLWIRFLSAVASFARQSSAADASGATDPSAVSQEEIRKAGQDLAANLSQHGYGMAYVEARELQKQIRDMMELLSDGEILSAYGARDMWQVIDQVASKEFGATKNGARYRSMSTSGATVIAWLATKSDELGRGSSRPALNVDEIQRRVTRGASVTAAPSDYDLLNAVEQWLAAAGSSDADVDVQSRPEQSGRGPTDRV
jgi:hypothetical protein